MMSTHGSHDRPERPRAGVSYALLYIREHQARESCDRKLPYLVSEASRRQHYSQRRAHRAREDEQPPFPAELEDPPREEYL